MKAGKTLQELAAEITRQAESKLDITQSVEKLGLVVEGQAVNEDKVELAVGRRDGTTNYFGINSVAHNQLAEYTGIPAAYYRRLLEQDPLLLEKNVNRWLKEQKDDRRLVRTLDGKVRAFLSDRYRALDNEELAEGILPVLLEKKLSILSCEITDKRLYIKAVDERILRDVPTGKALGDGSHHFFDTISPGIVISNSEVGFGATSIEASVFTRACTNLALIGNLIRRAHVGGRAQVVDGAEALFTDRTRALTDKAVVAQLRDVVKGALDEARFAAHADKLKEAAGVKFAVKDVTEVVERFGKRAQLTEGTRKGILERLIEGGDFTKYGLHAAVTRHSADVADYDVATELERLGGEVIDLKPGEWKQLTAVA
jgi:hypothetical protein